MIINEGGSDYGQVSPKQSCVDVRFAWIDGEKRTHRHFGNSEWVEFQKKPTKCGRFL